jgi:serine/threonine protein kinase
LFPIQLKPTNIFLDKDEVRIGDFGLATTIMKKPGSSEMSGSMVFSFGEDVVTTPAGSAVLQSESNRSTSITLACMDESESESSMTNEESESGAVGTHLYTAPEGGSGTKGDMYSLGILLFEVRADVAFAASNAWRWNSRASTTDVLPLRHPYGARCRP